MPFINAPALYEPTGTKHKSGRPYYVMTANLGYWTPKVEAPQVNVRPGFITDLASIPRFLFLLKPDDPRWDDAAIIHDRACQMARDGKMSMKDADDILYYAMLELGAPKWIAYGFWSFVSLKHKFNI